MDENFLSFILNSLPMLVSYIDRDGRYRFMNQGYGKWFGFVPGDVIGLKVSEVIGPGYSAIEKYVDSALAGKFTEYEAKIHFQFGEVKERETHCTYVPDIGSDGVVRGFVALVQDITETRRTERLLANQRLQMMSSSKLAAIGEMAGSLAHEINNPLSVIHGRAERLKLLAADQNLNVIEVVKTAETIEATAMRISKIVNGLRTLSRDGEQDLIEKISLAKLIAETVELSVQRFKNQQIDLQIDPIDESIEIECRPVQISQVILNLLNNAFDAVSVIESGARKWIHLSVTPTGDKIQISVKNSGKGIPKALHEKIFEPFFTTKTSNKGTGLGLSISRAIVESHRGTLHLDGTCEVTRFVCELPRSQKAPAI